MLHTTSNALVLVPQPSCMYFRVLLHRHLYSVDYLDCTAFMYGAFEGALCLGGDVRVLLHRHYSRHFQASRLVVITALQTKTNKRKEKICQTPTNVHRRLRAYKDRRFSKCSLHAKDSYAFNTHINFGKTRENSDLQRRTAFHLSDRLIERSLIKGTTLHQVPHRIRLVAVTLSQISFCSTFKNVLHTLLRVSVTLIHVFVRKKLHEMKFVKLSGDYMEYCIWNERI